MADGNQLTILGKGLEAWNSWRLKHPQVAIDLSGADLRKLDFGLLPLIRSADDQGLIPNNSSWSFIMNEIVGYEIMPLNLRGADFRGANLDGADLRKAECRGCDFSGASLKGASLEGADLSSSRFVDTDLSGARIRGADLSESVLVRTRVEGADFGYSTVYGISVWDLAGEISDETNLLVTPPGALHLRTDSLALAQLIYFLAQNRHARDLVDTVSHRVVLLLGNFKKDRKAVLDAVRSALRSFGFIPMIFDYEGPASKDTTGMVETLARLAGIVIADLTDPSSVPHELATTVPFLRRTPVLLIREKGTSGYSMGRDLEAYPWVIGVHQYETSALLVDKLPELVRRATALAERYRSKSGE